MADYLGTTGNDDLDQSKLKLSDWSGVIKGLAGNDKLTGGNIQLQGGPGKDILIGTTANTTVIYWDSPKGISANLKSGLVEDGWGDVDTLVNIHNIQGSSFPDIFIGSDQSDNFWVGTLDTVSGGGGTDTVTIWEQSSAWKIIKLSSTQTRVIQLLTGKSVDLIDVEQIQFQDTTINLQLERSLAYKDTQPSLKVGQFLFCTSGDLNGDGLWDLVVCGGSFPPSPNIETAPQVLIQKSDGTFKKTTISGTVEGFVHPREIATGDFNGDGLKDIAIVGHGYDTAPFVGETPTVLLGQLGGGFKDISESLPQTPAFTHSLAVSDINFDGIDDIFLGNIWGQQQFTPRLLLGSKSGSFSQANLPVSVGVNALTENGTLPIASLMKDLNRDGFIDLIAGGGLTGVFVYKGHQNSGSLSRDFFDTNRQPLPAGRFGQGNTVTIDIQSIDVNKDGYQDLLLSQTSNAYEGRAIQVLIQTKTGGWVDETTTRINGLNLSDQWITFINLVDLNQDSHADILVSGSSGTQTAAWINDGTGKYFPSGSLNNGPAINGSYLLPGGDGKIFSIENLSNGVLTVNSFKVQPGLTGPNLTLPAELGAPGFNEQFYLNQHPEISLQISQGLFSSGLESYIANGIKQNHRAYAPGTFVWGTDRIDKVYYAGTKSLYKINKDASSDRDWQITGGSSGTYIDKLISIERIQFSSDSLALDINGNAGITAKIIGAIFGKQALSNKNYVGIGLNLLDSGWSYDNLAGLALDAAGAKTNDQIVSLLWTNVMGSKPTASDKAPFISMLINGMTAGALANLAADSSFNTANINLVGLTQTGIEYIPVS
jgi:hypothetical protein